jgi:hypothetical protein
MCCADAEEKQGMLRSAAVATISRFFFMEWDFSFRR